MSWIILIFVLLVASIKNKESKPNMTVSVVIPAFNEVKTVEHVIKVVKSLNYINEIIVVDDGSEDGTAEAAEKAGATVIKHSNNKGKGAALNTGFKNSKGDIVAFIDADLHNLTSKQIEDIIMPILDGKADVTKTKFKRKAGRVTELTAKPLLNFFFPELKFEQPLSGQFAAKRSFLNNIKFEEDYGVDVGIVLDADARGMKIKEVDIGEIEHSMSTLTELNATANEVVRTIVDKAMEYGRVSMMDTLGKYIRMSILGLSLSSLGVFSVFFIKKVPAAAGAILVIVGLIIALYYIIKLLKRSFNIIIRPDRKSTSLKSFLYMHFPIIVSALILMAMLVTLLGAVHVDEGKISIEPASSNLVIWIDPTKIRTIDVRGPYTVDGTLENENSTLRVPSEAMSSLELGYGDVLYINDKKYNLTQTVPGEENILRMPAEPRATLDLNIGDIIRDSNIRNVFEDLYAEKSLLSNSSNLQIKEGIFLKNGNVNGNTVNIYMDNQLISTTAGKLKNGTYEIYVNNVKEKTVYYNSKNTKNIYYVYWGEHTIKVEVGGPINSNVAFADANKGRFLNIIFKNN